MSSNPEDLESKIPAEAPAEEGDDDDDLDSETKMPKRKRDNESLEEYRKRNALYSRRSYYRRREKFRNLETEAMLLKEQNYGLQKERVRLEGLMAQAQLVFRTYGGNPPPGGPPGGSQPPHPPPMWPSGYFPFMNPQMAAVMMQQNPSMAGMMFPGMEVGEEKTEDRNKQDANGNGDAEGDEDEK